MRFKHFVYLSSISIFLAALSSWSTPAVLVSEQFDLLLKIETFDKWINIANINLPFETYHPQGIVKIGDSFFLTAIDGNLAGYLIKFDLKSSGTGRIGTSDDILSKTATFIRQVQLADP